MQVRSKHQLVQDTPEYRDIDCDAWSETEAGAVWRRRVWLDKESRMLHLGELLLSPTPDDPFEQTKLTPPPYIDNALHEQIVRARQDMINWAAQNDSFGSRREVRSNKQVDQREAAEELAAWCRKWGPFTQDAVLQDITVHADCDSVCTINAQVLVMKKDGSPAVP